MFSGAARVFDALWASALREPYPRAASVRGKQPNYHGAKNGLENDVAR
jgi:hypothetical protein